MSIGHKDPALHTAEILLATICECGETKHEHGPKGDCGAQGCICVKFRPAKLKVTRVKS